jgi:hypothetical protein
MRRLTLLGLALGVALLTLAGAAGEDEKKKPDEEKALAAALKKARVNGKYQMLLRQIKVPGDVNTYGEFNDYGRFQGNSYAGFNDLPNGLWVYVAPYWYIWHERKQDAGPKRAWGPEQATGEPDTQMAGDLETAWASLTEDASDEWLMLEYAEPIVPKEIHVYETFNPGAVIKATAFRLDGSEVEVWKGKDPSAGKDIGVSVLPVKNGFKTARIKLYIDSKNVPGWNEIDAVGLKDDKGKMFWATAAAASSTYAQQEVDTDARERRIRELEREVKELREKLKKLEDMLDKKDK